MQGLEIYNITGIYFQEILNTDIAAVTILRF